MSAHSVEIKINYNDLFESSLDFLFIVELNGNILDVNEVAVNTLGYSKNNILAMNITDLIVDEEYDQVSHNKKELIDIGRMSQYNIYKIKKKNGDLIYLESHGIPLRKYGEIYAILGIGHEVTDTKNAEQRIKSSETKYRNLTDKVDTKQELKESEEKFRTITEQSFIGVIIEQDFMLKYINHQFSIILGYNSEEILSWKLSDFYEIAHPDDVDRFKKLIIEMTTGLLDNITNFQFRFFKKTGEIIWLELFSRKIMYKNRSANLAFIMDITDKKESEQKIRDSKEKFHTLFNNSTSGIAYHEIVYDSKDNPINYIITDVNPRFEEILHLKKEDVINKLSNEVYGTKSPPYLEIYSQVTKIKQSKSFETYFLPMKKYFKVSAISQKNGEFITVFDDITSRKNAEQELQESEKIFRTITEQSFMGIVIVQDGILKYLNQAALKTFGFSYDEMIDKSAFEFLSAVHPDDKLDIIKRLSYTVSQKKVLSSNNIYRIIHKDGEVRWVEDYANRIIYKGKDANILTLIDITDIKEAERVILEENKRLSELQELRKDIITRVSHELKTPMTSIWGSIQILLDLYEKEMSEQALNYLNIGHRGCLRLKDLIESLLDVSRLDSKKMELRYNNENIVKLIEDCTADMIYLADKRNIFIQLDLPDELYMDIDKLRFSQVITNIISNAIKNSQPKGIIYITLTSYDDHIDVRIKDTGVGLTQEEKSLLFQKFGKIERYGKDLNVDIEGVGLGLYISKEIIELHGGEILVESEGRNKGSTFIIRLFK